MPAIDLTYPIAAGMPVYPGTPSPVVHTIARFDRDHFRERQLTFCSHTGTHMDAPAHLLSQGETLANLNRLPEGRFAELLWLPLHITESDGAPTRVVAFL